MNAPKITNRQLLDLIQTYWAWRALWISTTVMFALLGLSYVLFLKSDTWVASQGLIVRDEANGAVMRLGRFQSQTEMKTAQETILEMARNSHVLGNALNKVGRSQKMFGLFQENSPPSTAEIDELAKNCIEVRAPRGAELGTTEVIYLDIKQPSQTRALELNKAVCDALEEQLQTVRKARADGVISELTTAMQAAENSLAEATVRLQAIESEAGADLADLRGLTDTNSGGNTNRQVLDAIKSEQRQVELQRHQLAIDLNLAKESFENPDALLLTPSRLVTNQAGLKKLREGLADASINTSGLRGRFTDINPIVVAAVETENRIRSQLREELGLAIATLAKDIEVTDQQLAKLQSQQQQLEKRLEKLAEIRAEYSNVASDVRSRNTQLQEIRRELAQATASRDSAGVSSLLTRLDEPLLGERPIGPGRSVILAGATVSGLLFGLGIVFLLTPLEGHKMFGRRQQDFVMDRRAKSSPQPPGSPTEFGRGTIPMLTSVNAFSPGPKAAVRAVDVLNPRSPSAARTRATDRPKADTEEKNINGSQPVNFAELCSQPPTASTTSSGKTSQTPTTLGSGVNDKAEAKVLDGISIESAQAIIAAALNPMSGTFSSPPTSQGR